MTPQFGDRLPGSGGKELPLKSEARRVSKMPTSFSSEPDKRVCRGSFYSSSDCK